MRNFINIIIFLLLFVYGNQTYAQIVEDGKAGLVITPTRVELDSKTRSATVTIANNGTKSGSYRIQPVNKIMTADGKLEDAKAEDDKGMFADQILRISPKSVTVAAGESQIVRLLVRKPKDFKEGEYRTHLSVMILPDDIAASESEDAESSDKLVIAIKANYGVTIPVIIRNGNLTANATMGAISVVNDPASNNKSIKFNVSRDGASSLYGDIKIIHANDKNEEKLLKFIGGIAIYTPNNLREFNIELDKEIALPTSGTLKVVYQEKEKAGGKIIAQNELKL